MMGGGSDVYATRLAMEERREMLEEKRWDKYMRNMMMMIIIINMQRMMGAQALMIGGPVGDAHRGDRSDTQRACSIAQGLRRHL
jgi:hypothetical protein